MIIEIFYIITFIVLFYIYYHYIYIKKSNEGLYKVMNYKFNIGDIILVEYDIKGKTTLIFDVLSMSYSITFGAEFIIDWDKTCSMRLSIAGCITRGYLVDVTKNVDRNFKLEQLGI